MTSAGCSRFIPLAMLVGVMLCLSLKTVPGLQVYALLAILLRFLRQKVPAVRWLLFAMLSGFFLAAFALLQADQHRLAASSIGTDIELQIRIQTIPVRQGRRTVFEAIRVDEHLGPSRLRLSYYGYGLDFKAGEQWRVTARLKPPDGLKNSGGFDRARWSIARGIHANGYLRESPRPERLAEAPGLSSTVLRQRLSASIAALPSATQTTAFVQALTLGLKHDISDQQWQLLRDSGTAHLLAISGLHISLMAGWALLIGTLVCRLLRHCFRNWPFSARSSGLCLALLIGSAYAMLAGFSLPTQRALIMLLVWSLAALRFRKLDASSGLGLALIAVLLFDPLAPLSPGFWLSFGTLAAILWLHTGKARPYSTQAPSMWARIVALFRVHVLLAIALLPVTALFFQSASLVSPLANLIAIPYVGLLIVPLSLLTLVFALPLPSLADFLLRLTHVLLEQMLNALDWMLIRLDGAIVASLPDLFTLFVCLLAFMLLCLPKILGWRWLAIPLILPALAFNARGSSVEELELHVLDVGQGLAALVLTRNHTVLYDTGGRMSPSLSMFESVVIPYLHALGRRRIDLLVVSHPDADHSAGVADALRRFPDMLVHASARTDDMMTEPLACQAGHTWVMDEVRFSYLYPALGDEGSENEQSCVLLVHKGRSRLLLTGDIEAASELRLAARLDVPLPVSVMTAPHHGSRSSSTAELLGTFSPEHVVFPAGLRNRWGFPHPEVQMRYKLGHSKTFVTGESGAVQFVFNAQGLVGEPTSWLDRHSRLWHALVRPLCRPLGSKMDQSLHKSVTLLTGTTLCGK